MPIYEFVCHDCGHDFEKIQSFSDSSTPSCPNCQGVHVRRRISPPAIHFKGSGWYITDSKSSSKASANGRTDEGGEKSEKKETTESTSPAESKATEKSSETTAAKSE